MKKPCILFSLLLSGLCAFAKPNFVVVLVDDHAFEAISAYGTYLKDFAKTPAILLKDTGTQRVRLEVPEGAALLLPAYWHHQVESFAAPGQLNVAVNYWFQGHSLATRLYRTLRENVFINCSEPVKPGQLHPCRD